MRELLLIFLLFPLFSAAHPGIAIVKDSKGTIYYSDLMQVWKIQKGIKSIAVPNVHTHELYVDKNDNLYGEGGFYRAEPTAKFFHYLWVLRPGGSLDTVISMREAYIDVDYSLARDPEGNEYYVKEFIRDSDTSHLFKRSPDGEEKIFAKGNFKSVRWLHPQKDGSLFYVQNNNVYKISRRGNVELLAKGIGNNTPSFKFSGTSITVWGVWKDVGNDVYVAVFSDQTVKKIQPNGAVTNYYKSDTNWAPIHGIFDDHGELWLLESSDKNEVRVIKP